MCPYTTGYNCKCTIRSQSKLKTVCHVYLQIQVITSSSTSCCVIPDRTGLKTKEETYWDAHVCGVPHNRNYHLIHLNKFTPTFPATVYLTTAGISVKLQIILNKQKSVSSLMRTSEVMSLKQSLFSKIRCRRLWYFHLNSNYSFLCNSFFFYLLKLVIRFSARNFIFLFSLFEEKNHVDTEAGGELGQSV